MKKRRLWKAAALLLVALLLTGALACGKKFDARAYVQAVMDLVTKHDAEPYMKVTGGDKEDAEEVYEKSFAEMDEMVEELEKSGFPKELSGSFADYLKKVMAKTKYTVTEAKEEKGTYTVSVEVEPVKIFTGVEDALTERVNAYVTQVQEDVLNGAEAPAESEIMTQVYSMMLEVLNENLDNVTYGEKKTVEARIVKNDDGEYEVDEQSFVSLGEALIDMEGVDGAGLFQ